MAEDVACQLENLKYLFRNQAIVISRVSSGRLSAHGIGDSQKRDKDEMLLFDIISYS